MANIPLISAISGLFEGLIKAVDEWHTSDEEKLVAKGQIFVAQGELLNSVFDYESRILQMQVDIIQSEAKGESWLQRNWRPMTMLFMMGLVGAYWFGLTPGSLSQDTVDNLFLLVQLGLGGYVVGRSAEKIARSIDFKGASSTKE